MKNDIQLNQKQELKLNPEMLQSIRILQMNSAELSEYLEQEILENPVLESIESSEEEISSEDLGEQMDAVDADCFDAYDRFEYGGTEDYEKFVRREETLEEHLLQQLGANDISPEVLSAGEYLIGNLDEDGYLFLTEEEFCQDTGGSSSDWKKALSIIQEMDPAGVGARSLKECLHLQLEARNLWTPLMEKLIGDMLEDIAANRIARIASALEIKKSVAEEMVRVVRSLEPKPGSRFANGQAVPFVVPDVIAEMDGGEVQICVNEEGMRSLQYASYYTELYQEGSTPAEVRKYLAKQFASANTLLENVHQRNQTLLRVAEAIARHQKQFFEPGVRLLRPLTMQEIAEELHMHVSTVSRAVAGKYMQCETITVPLKHFFGSGVKRQTEDTSDGDKDVSAMAIRQVMRDLIGKEDSAHPLSDQKIANLLTAQGIQISRRTVTKYREKEGIETASRRKR